MEILDEKTNELLTNRCEDISKQLREALPKFTLPHDLWQMSLPGIFVGGNNSHPKDCYFLEYKPRGSYNPNSSIFDSDYKGLIVGCYADGRLTLTQSKICHFLSIDDLIAEFKIYYRFCNFQ